MLHGNAQFERPHTETFSAIGALLYRHIAQDLGKLPCRADDRAHEGLCIAQAAQADGVKLAIFVRQRGKIEQILGAESAGRFFAIYKVAVSVMSGRFKF